MEEDKTGLTLKVGKFFDRTGKTPGVESESPARRRFFFL
jgi:hypothetical protein